MARMYGVWKADAPYFSRHRRLDRNLKKKTRKGDDGRHEQRGEEFKGKAREEVDVTGLMCAPCTVVRD